MNGSYILAAGLVVFAVIAVLGATGNLSGPTQRCIDRGGVRSGVKGAKCLERTPELDRRMEEGVSWTGK